MFSDYSKSEAKWLCVESRSSLTERVNTSALLIGVSGMDDATVELSASSPFEGFAPKSNAGAGSSCNSYVSIDLVFASNVSFISRASIASVIRQC